MGDIVFYDYWRSSAAYRVRIALGLLGLPVTRIHVNLVDGTQRSADHLDRNPQGLVPVIEIDGLRLTQSLAILEYLDEVHGAHLLPTDSAGRARVRALSMAVAMEIHPVCNLRVVRHAVAASGGVIAQEDWMRHFIASGLADLEAMLASGSGHFCHGDSVTMADLCLVPQVYNARRWEVDLTPLPRLTAIADRAAALPAFAAAHPDRIRPTA
jgi:maleylacetoacetate isomerase